MFAAEILLATGIVPGRWTQRAYGDGTACPCKRQKRSRPYVGSKNSAPGFACGPHETHRTKELAAEISLAAGTVPDRRTQRAYGNAARVKRHKRFKALSGSRGAETGCTY